MKNAPQQRPRNEDGTYASCSKEKIQTREDKIHAAARETYLYTLDHLCITKTIERMKKKKGGRPYEV